MLEPKAVEAVDFHGPCLVKETVMEVLAKVVEGVYDSTVEAEERESVK